MNKVRVAPILSVLTLISVVQPARSQEQILSPAEKKVVDRQIETLKSPIDRSVAESWSDAKKIAELICRPAALPSLRKQDSRADRVFLGTDAPSSLTLESNSRLIGTGQYRTFHGWQDFSFTCDINPVTAKVNAFHIVQPQSQPQ